MTDFSALLDKPLDDYERPKPLPVGSYVATVGQVKYDKTTGEKQTPYAEFPIVPTEAMPDVDQDALAAALNGKPLTEFALKQTFYLTENAMFRLKEFVQAAGVQEGIPASEQIQQAIGQQVVITIKHTPNKKDPKSVYAEIAQITALPQ